MVGGLAMTGSVDYGQYFVFGNIWADDRDAET